MLTRKDFVALAEIIKTNKSDILENGVYFHNLVQDITVFCKKSNNSFNTSKFLEACGYDNV